MWIASVPELPGCMADGETQEDALRATDVAIEAWLGEARRLGRNIPREKPTIDSLERLASVLNISSFARMMGISTRTLHSKIERKAPLTHEEAEKVERVLDELGLALVK